MVRSDPAVRAAGRSLRLVLTGVLALGAACGPGSERGRPRPTPAPHFTSVATASRADLLAYAHGLQFDTTRPASDAQYLVVPRAGQLAVGPYATVAPEIGSGSITRTSLAEGRILARLTLAQPCPEAGLPAGAAYLWVDSTAGGFRTLLIPELDSVPPIVLRLQMLSACEPGSPQWQQAAAWLDVENVPADSLTMIHCWTCDCTICCGASMLRDLAPPRMPPARMPLDRRSPLR